MIARIGIGEHREFDEEVVPVVRKRHGIRVIDIPERDARSFPCGNGPQRTIVHLEVCEHDRQSRLVGLRAIAGEYHQPIRSSESNASVIDLRRSVSVEEERLHVGRYNIGIDMLGIAQAVRRKGKDRIIRGNPHPAVFIPGNIADTFVFQIRESRHGLKAPFRRNTDRKSVRKSSGPDTPRIVGLQAIDMIGNHAVVACILPPGSVCRTDMQNALAVGSDPDIACFVAADVEHISLIEWRSVSEPFSSGVETPVCRFDVNT